MITLDLTPHAAVRMSQRGLTANAVALIIFIGTEVEGGYLVREKDFQEFDRVLKQLREQARRTVGKRIVVEGRQVHTAYHAGHRKQRALLRDGRM